jgi:DNA polymerase sigma
MNETDRTILSLFTASVRQQFPTAEIKAFGSRTRDTAAPDSDLDVCIVLEKLNDANDQMIMDIAWEVGFEHDVVISTVTYARSEFEHGPVSESPLIKTILHEGIAA